MTHTYRHSAMLVLRTPKATSHLQELAWNFSILGTVMNVDSIHILYIYIQIVWIQYVCSISCIDIEIVYIQYHRIVQRWCTHSIQIAYVQYTYSIRIVHIQYRDSIHVVKRSYAHNMHIVHIQYTHSIHIVYTCIHIVYMYRDRIESAQVQCMLVQIQYSCSVCQYTHLYTISYSIVVVYVSIHISILSRYYV